MASPPQDKEQLLLRHARREALVIMVVWTIDLLWSVGVCYLMGYNRDPQTVTLILGMPDWVFWGIVLPWGLTLLFSGWFCFVFMADDDLGKDMAEEEPHA